MRHDEPIMDLLHTEGRPMTCKEIAERLNTPRNSVQRTVRSLYRFRMVRPGPEVHMKGHGTVSTWEAVE